MRSGHHFAQLMEIAAGDMMCGVIRPDWDVEWGDNAEEVDGHCFFNTGGGGCYPGCRGWEGNQDSGQDTHIGMLLDLDQVSMTVWMNDVKLGVMVAEGLSGPYCWAVSIVWPGWAETGTAALIESTPAPPSPTEKELVAAIAWQEVHADD